MSRYTEQNCDFEYTGKTFSASGAVIDDGALIAYLHGADNHIGAKGDVINWHGDLLGTYVVVSRWPVNSFMASHMVAVRIRVDAKSYHGRGFGNGMLVRAKRSKS